MIIPIVKTFSDLRSGNVDLYYFDTDPKPVPYREKTVPDPNSELGKKKNRILKKYKIVKNKTYTKT